MTPASLARLWASPIELLLQRRRSVSVAAQQTGDAADLGVHAGGGDDQLAAAAGDRGVHEDHVLAVAEWHVGPVDRVGAFTRRLALAGERRLLDLEVVGQQQAAVGGHAVAGLDQHDVARHQLAGGHVGQLAVAAHPGLRHQHLRSASSDRSARFSWTKPMIALNSTT
jgi:hypothetical protein